MLTFGNLSFTIADIFYRGLIMKKVFKILNLLSVVAMSCVLICCSGGGSSSDDEDVAVESTPETPAVSTTETPTVSTPTTYLARVMYTSRRGEYINNGKADANHDLYEGGYALPLVMTVDHIRVEPIDDLSTNPETARFYIMADAGFYLEIQGNLYSALVLPDGIIGNEIDPVTNYWVR